MRDVEREIVVLQGEIVKANGVIVETLRKRRETHKDSPFRLDHNEAIAAARQTLADAEIRLRQLYESKSNE